MLRRPGIPSIDPNVPANLASVLQPMKEAIEISLGVRSSGQQVGSGIGYDGWKRRSVTMNMLIKSGLLTEAQCLKLYQEEN